MPPGYAAGSDLKQWADTVQASSELPRLIRRLILETNGCVSLLDFPAGDAVTTGGWDGICRTSEATTWVPEGRSLWELSVDKKPGVKADRDYGKRHDTPDGSAPTDATYVQAILRPWTQRQSWASTKTDEGKWREVWAFGLDDIDQWLEAAPITHAWFSELLGLSPFGLRSAEAWWQAWANQTRPGLTPEVLLAGRDNATDRLNTRLRGNGGVVTVSHPNADEVAAFVAAVIHQPDDSGIPRHLARTAFVDDRGTFRKLLADRNNQLVLVPASPEMAREVEPDTIHHVVVPTTADADIELDLVDPYGVAVALEDLGVPADEARAHGQMARRSLTALRRRLAKSPALHVPPWAEGSPDRVVRSVLLLHGWSESSEGDRSAAATVAGPEYEGFQERLASLGDPTDPLAQHFASGWSLVSPVDAWRLLGRHLTTNDLQRLADLCLEVLDEDDPALDYPDDQRWLANFEGRTRQYSFALRSGLAKTLALLATVGGEVNGPKGTTGNSWAAHIVRQLVEPAADDLSGRRWISLISQIGSLIEAAPDVVLDSLERSCRGEDPPLRHVFKDGDGRGALGPSSPHTELLWALERAAWSEEHFSPVVMVLASLDVLDPGGTYQNRPLQSLIDIFCPWNPQTAVGITGRLAVLDRLSHQHPDLAWRLLVALLPEHSGFLTPNARPEFRDWKPVEERAVTTVEYGRLVDEVIERCVDRVGLDPGRWKELLDRFGYLPPSGREAVKAGLTAAAQPNAAMEPADREALWNLVQALVEKHREYADSQWALPSEEVDSLAEISTQIMSDDSTVRIRRLFREARPYLGDVNSGGDHDAYRAALQEARTEAARAVANDGGLEAIRELASREGTQRGAVGMALARAHPDDFLPVMLEDLKDRPVAECDLALAYLFQMYRDRGWSWLSDLVDDQRETLTSNMLGVPLSIVNEYPRAAEKADALGPEVANNYWKRFSTYGLGLDFNGVSAAVPRLLAVGRAAAALDLIGLCIRKEDESAPQLATLAADSLEILAQTDDDPDLSDLHHYVFEEIFRVLQEQAETVGRDRVATLEWQFLPTLGFEPDARMLHRKLSISPDFFVEVLTAIYPGNTRPSDEPPSDQQRRIGELAYRLLSSWSRCPGVNLKDQPLDKAALRTWVDKTCVLIDEADVSEVGRQQIGKVLIYAPIGDDGIVPSKDVRDLLEDLADKEIETGVYLGIVNSRGVTTRSPGAGGQQERELAERYEDQAKSSREQWPRTARVLRDIAKSYTADARRQDLNTEAFRRGER